MTIELKSARLRLRLVVQADLQFIHDLHSLPDTDEFNTLGIPSNIDETINVLNAWLDDYSAQPPSGFTLVIETMKHGKPIGLIGLKGGKPKYHSAEAWYKLVPQEWGKGYATEALKTLMEYGFEKLKLHRIEAGCAAANTGSVRVLEKAGMKREGMKRKALPLKSGWADNYFYGILADEYRGGR